MGRRKKEAIEQNEEKFNGGTMESAVANQSQNIIGCFGVSTPDTSREELLEQQKAYDNVMVTGKFINQRAPGQSVKLTYHKYNTDPVKWYEFKHNQVYTIPRGFADQINEHYAKLIHAEGQRAGGKEVVTRTDGGFTELAAPIREQIYAFVPTNF